MQQKLLGSVDVGWRCRSKNYFAFPRNASVSGVPSLGGCHHHLQPHSQCMLAGFQFASLYKSSTSLTKSCTSLPPSQYFHTPPSLTQRTSLFKRTVQLIVTFISRLRSADLRSRLMPCKSSSLIQALILLKSRPCSRAQLSTKLRAGIWG